MKMTVPTACNQTEKPWGCALTTQESCEEWGVHCIGIVACVLFSNIVTQGVYQHRDLPICGGTPQSASPD
jgi:hypothetical protein